MGPLLKDLETKMRAAAQASGTSPAHAGQKSSPASLNSVSLTSEHEKETGAKSIPKILVHSTHDTALSALLSTLDVYDEKYVLRTYRDIVGSGL